MRPERKAPPGKGGARDCFPGWSRFADTLAGLNPQLPPLIACHLGAEAFAVAAMLGAMNGGAL